MKHPDPTDPEFYTEMTPESQIFVDRFRAIVDREHIMVRNFDFMRGSMAFMPIIIFDAIGLFYEQIVALRKEFPTVLYDNEQNPKLPWNVLDGDYEAEVETNERQ